jgi:hypothetical protein
VLSVSNNIAEGFERGTGITHVFVHRPRFSGRNTIDALPARTHA